MAMEKKENDVAIIDLVRYKIERQLRVLPSGSIERKMNESILGLYELGVVKVTWSKDDMLISMVDGSDISPGLLGQPLEDDDEMEIIYHESEKPDQGMEIEFIPDFTIDDEAPDELDE